MSTWRFCDADAVINVPTVLLTQLQVKIKCLSMMILKTYSIIATILTVEFGKPFPVQQKDDEDDSDDDENAQSNSNRDTDFY